MSDPHHSPSDHDSHEVHEGPIKTPRQLILAVFFSFVIPIAVIVLLALSVDSGNRVGAGTEVDAAEATGKRIQPIARVAIKDASDVASLKSGEQVFTAQCGTCHTAGVAGAPKVGDAAAWGPRIAQGFATLLNSALKGKGAMGPQGGGDFTDFEIARAVVFMANKSGGKLEEPKAPAAADAASGAAASAPPASAASAK